MGYGAPFILLTWLNDWKWMMGWFAILWMLPELCGFNTWVSLPCKPCGTDAKYYLAPSRQSRVLYPFLFISKMRHKQLTPQVQRREASNHFSHPTKQGAMGYTSHQTKESTTLISGWWLVFHFAKHARCGYLSYGNRLPFLILPIMTKENAVPDASSSFRHAEVQ